MLQADVLVGANHAVEACGVLTAGAVAARSPSGAVSEHVRRLALPRQRQRLAVEDLQFSCWSARMRLSMARTRA